MRDIRLALLMLACAAAVAACGGGGGGTSGGRGSSVIPQGAHQAPAVSLRLVIPNSTTASLRARHPAYVSQAIQSIVYQITAPNSTTPLVSGANYTNLNASTCATATNGLNCSIVISAALPASGSYIVSLATYDAAQTAACTPAGTGCAGNLLGNASLPETITIGSAAPLDVTLGGVPALFVPVGLSNFATGYKNSNNGLTIFGPATQTGQFELQDADNNVIINPGAPNVTVTTQDTAQLTVALPSPNALGVYTVSFTAVKSGAYVQPGTYPITLTAAVTNTATTLSKTFDVTIEHSGVFVATCNESQSFVYGYLDGNTTGSSPDLTISVAPACINESYAPGIAADSNGNLYVADQSFVGSYVIAPGTPTPQATASPPESLISAMGIAADRDGNVYFSDFEYGNIYAYASPGPGTFGTLAATVSSYDFDECNYLATDDTGNLYAAVTDDGDLQIYRLPSLDGGLANGSTPTNPITLNSDAWSFGAGIATDVQPSPSSPPDLWLGIEESDGGGELLHDTSTGTGIDTYTSSLGNVVFGTAVDGAGTVYAAVGGSSYEVTTLTSPGYSSGTTITPPGQGSISAINVAVVPAAGIIGNNSGGNPSPIGDRRKRP